MQSNNVATQALVTRVVARFGSTERRRSRRSGNLSLTTETILLRSTRRQQSAAPTGNAVPQISPGTFAVKHPLDVMQIDHAPMDTVCVDELKRRPAAR